MIKRISALLILLLVAHVLVSAQDKSYMIVFLNKKADLPKLPPEEAKRISEGHFANIEKLAKEGKLLAAGPFDGGGGIFVMNTTSQADVEQWISPDPGVQAKRWNIEILPYQPRYGGICPQSPDSIKMVNYTFIRYHVAVAKFNANTYPALLAAHNKFLADRRQPNVITEAAFGEREGGVLIIEGEPDPELLAKDPAIQDGLVEAEVKKLYIAKGSFCEKK